MGSSSHWKKQPYCTNCQKKFDIPYLWCPECGSLNCIDPIDGVPKPKSPIQNIWDFSAFFPQFKHKISMAEGNTSIMTLKNTPILKELQVKLEFRNPTGNFRDRAAALIISDALSRNYTNLLTVSTGSFSISMAAYAARAQLHSVCISPHNIELSKVEQMKIYGSEVILEGDTIDKTLSFAKKYADTHAELDFYTPKPNENILMIEGQKTIGLEIAFARQNIENLIIPRGSGTLLYSIYKGLLDAQQSGWIDTIPHIYAVSLKKTHDSHLVEALETSDPLLSDEINQILENTDGHEVKISANTMTDDALQLGKEEGLFIEPASASVISATKELMEEIPNFHINQTLAILTGSGLNAMNIFAAQMRDMKKVVWGLSPTTTRKFEILRLIIEGKAHHGYGIWVSLGKQSSLQSIYQHLTNLEVEGLIKNTDQEAKKAHYEITGKGKDTFERMKELLDLRN